MATAQGTTATTATTTNAKQRIAIALWNYDAQEDNELSFVAGDRIIISEFCNEDWYEGSLATASGFFPANHVKVLPEASSIAVIQSSTDSQRPSITTSASIDTTGSSQYRTLEASLQNPSLTASPSPSASAGASQTAASGASGADGRRTPASQQNKETDSSARGNVHKSTTQQSISGIERRAADNNVAEDEDPSHMDDIQSEDNLAEDNWHIVTTEDGQVYYWNSTTGETSWDPPPGFTPSESLDNFVIDEGDEDEFNAQGGGANASNSMQVSLPSTGPQHASAATSSIDTAFQRGTTTTTPQSAMSISSIGTGVGSAVSGVKRLSGTNQSSDNVSKVVPAMSRIEIVLPELIRREGWLSYRVRKEFGGIEPKKSHSAHHHWAVVCVGFLIFYKDEPSKLKKRFDRTPVHPVLIITLESVTMNREKDTGNKKKNGVFTIHTRSGAVWALQPPNETEVNEWMVTISEATREASSDAEYDNVMVKLFSQSAHRVSDQQQQQPPPPPAHSSGSAGAEEGGGHRKKSDDKRIHKNESKKSKDRAPSLTNDPSEDGDPANKTKTKTKLNAFFKRQQEKTGTGDSDAPGSSGSKNASGGPGSTPAVVSDDTLFGGLLTEHTQRDGRPIPQIVEKCIHAIDTRGLKSQGIYRLSGNAATIQRIRHQLNQGIYTDLDDESLDLNVISGLLKLYFRELKTPLIPFNHYDQFITCMKIDDYNDRLIEIKNLVQTLPKPHYDVLEYLLRHLVRVASHSDVNKMEPSNLAIVFGPTILRGLSHGHDDMQAAYANMMNMSYQNALVEAIVVQTEWMFDGSPN